VREVFSGIDGVRSVEILAGSGADELRLALKGETAGDLRARIFSAVVDNGWVMLGLGRRQVDLEGIFRSLTTGGGGKEVA